MSFYSVSLTKPAESGPCEDAVFASDSCIAVSDGAGGCGLYADEWSQYLLDKLPKDKPLATFKQFDSWLDTIWEPFYNDHELRARQTDPSMLLSKFLHEGSCATLAAAWRTAKGFRWMAYGDSVVFCYHPRTDVLERSPIRLVQFAQPPCLVSCVDPLIRTAFHAGRFEADPDAVIFAASDALSHYIIMRYEVSHSNRFIDELDEARQAATANALLLRTAEAAAVSFPQCLAQLLDSARERGSFCQLMMQLHDDSLLDLDDYSLAILTPDN